MSCWNCSITASLAVDAIRARRTGAGHYHGAARNDEGVTRSSGFTTLRRLAARKRSQPIHHPTCFAHRRFGLRHTAAQKLRGIHRHAFRCQLRQRVQQLHQRILIAIDLNEARIFAIQDLPRQSGKHALGTHFHEHARALLVHGANLVHEFYRPHQMAGQQRRDFLGIFRILRAQRIGENCRARVWRKSAAPAPRRIVRAPAPSAANGTRRPPGSAAPQAPPPPAS